MLTLFLLAFLPYQVNNNNSSSTNMNNNNNNNNNNNSTNMNNNNIIRASNAIDFNARLLQEMMALRNDINQQGVQLNVLNDGFRQQFSSPSNEEGDAISRGILDPLNRSQMLSNVNRRGPRVIQPNVSGKPRASPVERYNAMLQHLHKLCNGSNAPDLTNGQLKSRREKLHRSAKRVAEAIMVMHPDLQRWSALDSVQDEQTYYSLALEEQVLQRENLTIYMCKKQWCARMLLSQAFKAIRASKARVDAVAATVDADAVADAAFIAALNESNSSLASQTAGQMNVSGVQDDDDNLSTTSNM